MSAPVPGPLHPLLTSGVEYPFVKGIDGYPEVQRALAAFLARSAVQAGLLVPAPDTPSTPS